MLRKSVALTNSRDATECVEYGVADIAESTVEIVRAIAKFTGNDQEIRTTTKACRLTCLSYLRCFYSSDRTTRITFESRKTTGKVVITRSFSVW